MDRQARLDEFRKDWRPAKLRTESGVYEALCQNSNVEVGQYSAVMLINSDTPKHGGMLWAKFNGEIDSGSGQKILDLIDVADLFGGAVE